MAFISWNGSVIPESDFTIDVNNPGFRYGDGLFETMKARGGQLLLGNLHFERLFSSLQILQFSVGDELLKTSLENNIQELLIRNEHMQKARVRLMICRPDADALSSLTHTPQVLIQSWLLEESNNKRLTIDVFPHGRKSCDMYSALKSNNYLIYLLAGRFAQQNGVDDALVLNAYGRVAESSISNIFVVKNNVVTTPPVSEGCVDGVYRKYLLGRLKKDGIAYREEALTIESVLEAEEVFFTNAVRGIRSVQRFRQAEYGEALTADLKLRYKY